MAEQVKSKAMTTQHRGYAGTAGSSAIRALDSIEAGNEVRQPIGVAELDRVLGGGLVSGGVVLLGGDPGIGKSTLLLQVLARLSTTISVLYITGEESLQQLALRAERLKLDVKNVQCLSETCVETIMRQVGQHRPDVIVIDSIQTLFTEQLQSAPGSVAQVRESAAQLVRMAKASNVATFLVGHVTKEGGIAGPRVLEHMVDTVLFFEGDGSRRYRVLRAIKNRFGAVNELGVFAMTDGGLKEVANPSAMFLSGRGEASSGSAVLAAWEGTRPLLVEVQALVDRSPAQPRRVAVGVDPHRLAMLLAVMHRQAGIPVVDQDVFINVVGGVRIVETASDLALASAIYSSLRDSPLPMDLLVFGELGLGGELRPVPYGEDRLREAAKHGFKQAIVAQANAPKRAIAGMKVNAVKTLSQALDLLT
ncbi:MAG: DNA repair protein RadA [Lysobacteraceae bacterium]|nr:MAG: DNA repair protein RadA [Xanthomonadaceae bacterium]